MDLREAIIRTVCYYDIFDYPLTRAEIGRWLILEIPNNNDQITKKIQIINHESPNQDFAAVDEAVAALVSEGILKEEKGIVYLAGREGLAAERASRYRHSCRKWRRARRWARIFAALPGVELVGIGNTLAYHNAKDASDIDFFVVCAPGTIWRTRLFCAGLAAFCRLRPTAKSGRDKLCLSFFVTSAALGLTPLRFGAEDIYFGQWVRQLAPLAGRREAAERFLAANPGAAPRGEIAVGPGWLAKLFAPLGRLPGDFLKARQRRRLPPALIAAARQEDGSVIVSDDVLKFHANDRRRDIYERWRKRVDLILS